MWVVVGGREEKKQWTHISLRWGGGNCVIVKKIKRERTMLRVAHKDTDRERVNGQTGDDNGKKDVYQRIEKSEI